MDFRRYVVAVVAGVAILFGIVGCNVHWTSELKEFGIACVEQGGQMVDGNCTRP
jgi:hypothetical protein